MRDIGALLWVVIVIAGVISSIVSTARKQNAGRATAVRLPPRPLPVVPRAAPAPAPPPQPAVPGRAPLVLSSDVSQPPGILRARELDEPHKQATRLARKLFGHRSGLVRAVVAAEVLGKPRALRDEL